MTLPTTAETIRSGQTTLLVEDDEQLRLLAGRILQSHGYQVIMARTGAEALFVSERHEGPIHLLLSDVVMPHMKGTEMALRLTRQRPDMAILLMSGHPEDTLGIGPGVPFIQKPFTPDGLLRRVATVLADTAPKV